MRRTLICLVFFLLIAGLFYDLSSAQLINYGRRNRFLRATDPEMTEEESIPQWAKELLDPQNEEERRHDTNRDGKLQSAEVKVYLRTVIAQVENREYVNVTTDLLREYDKNKDGVINVNEIKFMKEHVK